MMSALLLGASIGAQDVMRITPPSPPPPPPIVRRGSPASDPASWFAVKDYPKGPKRRGEEGRVNVLLSIDKRGRPVGCNVTQTSGFPELDVATCSSVIKRARFRPQLGTTGKPEPFTWPVVMRWRLLD